jgi:DNA repair exonuclease SbcCD nuclease subunit
MKKIEKLEETSLYLDWEKKGIENSIRLVKVLTTINEIIEAYNSYFAPDQSQKQPEGVEYVNSNPEGTVIPESTTTRTEPEKQEEWREELLDLIDENGRVEDLEDVEFLYVTIRDFISQLLSERTREAKIQQLKEDMEQVEVFLPENTSDTEKYWIPTQILLELEDDLSKLLRGRL